MRKSTLVVALFVFWSSLLVGVMLLPEASATTRFVGGVGPGNYSSVQAAIDDAVPDDTIYVYSGTYFESITVSKPLTLVGEERDSTIIQGSMPGDAVSIASDYVNITRLAIWSSGSSSNDAAVKLLFSNHCSIADVNISWSAANGLYLDSSSYNSVSNSVVNGSRFDGIHSVFSNFNTFDDNEITLNSYDGIFLWGSDWNVIVNNSISYNNIGINLLDSSWATIANNSVMLNHMAGLRMYYSEHDTIVGNSFEDDGIYLVGEPVKYWNTHVIDTANTVNGKPVYYWKNLTGGKVPQGAGEVILANTTDVIVENQNVSNSSVGIAVGFSSNVTIANSTAYWNGMEGISLVWSTDSHIVNNTVKNNTFMTEDNKGIALYDSTNCTIADNTVMDNGYGIYLEDSDGNTIDNNTASWNDWTGIQLFYSHDATVTRNNVSRNRGEAITIFDSSQLTIAGNTVLRNSVGINLFSSTFSEIRWNNVSGNSDGIILWQSERDSIVNNTLAGNEWHGILLYDSGNDTMADNVLVRNGIFLMGNRLHQWNTHMIDTTNTVNGKPVYYWKNVSGGKVPEGAGEVILGNCTDVTVENQNIPNTSLSITTGFSSGIVMTNNSASNNSAYGVYLYSTTDSTVSRNTFNRMRASAIVLYESQFNVVTNNTAMNGRDGIRSFYSTNNSIIDNVLFSNEYGVYMVSSDGNDIFHNNFLENDVQAFDADMNQWDDGYPSGGNYWSDYAGNDTMSGPDQNVSGSDGLGDTPYLFDVTAQDSYPLMFPHGPASISPPTDLQATLSGGKDENVTLSWSLSLNDGAGNRSVTEYMVYRSAVFDPSGMGYGVVGSVPNGTTSFTDYLAGEADPSDYFYIVCAASPFNMTSCASRQAAKFTRPLAKGHNLVSVPLLQSDESIEQVLRTVKYDDTWAYDSWTQTWQSYARGKPYSAGMELNRTVGLWVNVTEDSNLTVAGVVPAQTMIHLEEGWNLVSFPSFNASHTVADVKVETGATRVEGYDPAPPYFLRVLGDAEMLQAGYGYWVRVEAETDWIVEVS